MREDEKYMEENLVIANRLLNIVRQSDYDFYTKLCCGMTDEEFEEFCKEFPEASIINRDEIRGKIDD